MITKEYLIETLIDVYQGQPWYGLSITDLLKKVNPAQINRKEGSASSIGEILHHTIAWRKFAIEMLRLNFEFDIKMDTETDWQMGKITKAQYHDLVVDFEKTQEELLTLIRAKEGNWLTDKLEKRNYDFAFLINGVIQHDIYHLGQIVILTKMFE